MDIVNRNKLRKLLISLDPGTKPRWGKMNPQQMTEHLNEELKWSRGKRACICNNSADEAYARKQK